MSPSAPRVRIDRSCTRRGAVLSTRGDRGRKRQEECRYCSEMAPSVTRLGRLARRRPSFVVTLCCAAHCSSSLRLCSATVRCKRGEQTPTSAVRSHSRVAVTGEAAEHGVGDVGALVEHRARKLLWSGSRWPYMMRASGLRFGPCARSDIGRRSRGWGPKSPPGRVLCGKPSRNRRTGCAAPAREARWTTVLPTASTSAVEAPPSALPARRPSVDPVSPTNDAPRCPFTSASADLPIAAGRGVDGPVVGIG